MTAPKPATVKDHSESIVAAYYPFSIPGARGRRSVITNNKTLGWAFLVAILVVFAIHALDFHGSVPNFRNRSGGGILLDIKPVFSVARVYERLESYGEEGRRVYFFRNYTVDVVLPLSVLPFLFLFMRKAVEAVRLGRLQRLFLVSLSIAYVVFDFAENAALLVLLDRFPDRVHLLAVVLPYLTTVKRAASILALVLPLALLGFAFVRKRLSRVA